MTKASISIARDFSPYPAGRFRSDGPFPGQKFREDVLEPALQAHDRVTVRFDALGYGSSFLEEAFGGLVRWSGYTAADLHSRLELDVRDRTVLKEVWSYIDKARPEKQALAR